LFVVRHGVVPYVLPAAATLHYLSIRGYNASSDHRWMFLGHNSLDARPGLQMARQRKEQGVTMIKTHLAPDLIAMSSNMSDAQAIVLIVITALALVGIVGDYITTEQIIGKGGSEGNPVVLWVMKKFHMSLPVFTFVVAAATLGVAGLAARVLGGWYPNLFVVPIAVSRLVQILKNRRLYKSIK
jgi:hypothetical protein